MYFLFYIFSIIGQGLNAIFNLYSSKVDLSVMGVLSLLLKFSPIFILSNLAFILYFGIGIKYQKFGVLYIISITIGILFSLLIQYFILKQNIQLNQIIGIFIVFIGIIVINYHKIFG